LQQIAALFVETGGIYSGLSDVDVWGIERDARNYAGPFPVIAHPPCERWGRYWHGSPRKPHQYRLGDDDGCFAAALHAVRKFGGVLEHPAYSRAFEAYGIMWPLVGAGWLRTRCGAFVCHVEQGHYGHMARKATWLYAVNCQLPILPWQPSPQRLPQIAVERYGYEKARRSGVMAYVGGANKKKIRGATPPAFRDMLLDIARSAVTQNSLLPLKSDADSRR
jgi:hypothetical protein